MGLIVLAVYTVVELWGRWSVRSLFSLMGAGFLGAAASSFYWIKLVTELKFLSHATAEFTKTAFDFNANFLLAYFYVGPDQYVTRSLWFADLICILTIGVIVCAVIIRRVSPVKDGRKLSQFLAASGVAVFLATPLSWAVWANFDLLQKIQFPFRFLGVISICAAVFAASACNGFLEIFASRKRPLALVSGGVLLFAAAFSFAQVIRPAMFLSQAKFDGLLAGLGSEKSCQCWWPVWAHPAALESRNSEDTNQIRSIPMRINGVEHSARIQISQNESSAVEVFYYPLWQLLVDDRAVDVGPDEVGRILVPNTALDRKLELVFVEPAYLRAAQATSIGAWIVIFIFSFASAVARPHRGIALIR